MSDGGPEKSKAAGAEESSDTFLSAEDEKRDTQVTCDVLCSLSSAYPQRAAAPEPPAAEPVREKRKPKACPKQHQLPLFLSKTYHMIDRCDTEIATWSASGDNFVVKNVEKFASNVLPLYFKHSNFSSFARQLNFYGFRKLRTDPILTSDVDPRTACYVRFYHDKFQKDRPELLHQIKRATKSDQQSKDEVESLKGEVTKLKECIGQMNHRINTLTSEYEKVTALLAELLTRSHQQQQQLQQQQQQQTTPPLAPAAAPQPIGTRGTYNPPDLMHSLSQVAAASLQSHLQATVQNSGGVKRENPEPERGPSSTRQRTG